MYAIESFMIPPYPLAKSKSDEDNFNFFHCSARITVECAFGEIDLRWVIFWRRLYGSIDNSFLIIQGATRIHNFLIDFRQDNVYEIRSDLNVDMANFMNKCDELGVLPGVIVNDNRRPSGRISDDERLRRSNGLLLRNSLRQAIKDHNMHRPIKNNAWNYDSNNHMVRE